MKIYTKTGDDGFTSLIGGNRVPKHHLRIESYGIVDELNAFIGLLSDEIEAMDLKIMLKQVQERLFTIGANLASDPQKAKMKIPDIHTADIEILEKEIDRMNEILPELKHFVLPGGNKAISSCHVARCVCRRAERNVVHLAEESFVNTIIPVYLNRLSDYLFVLARFISLKTGTPEKQWVPREKKL